MRPNPQFPADLVTFTEEILTGKLHFFCSVVCGQVYNNHYQTILRFYLLIRIPHDMLSRIAKLE